MKLTITKKHFDKAVKAKWHPATCLLAQAGKPHGIKTWGRSPRARKLMEKFDDLHYDPTPARKARLAKLRATLPITIEI